MPLSKRRNDTASFYKLYPITCDQGHLQGWVEASLDVAAPGFIGRPRRVSASHHPTVPAAMYRDPCIGMLVALQLRRLSAVKLMVTKADPSNPRETT